MEEENVNFIVRLAQRAFPDGGKLSGIFNLAGGSIGAGILGLPAAFHMSGIVVSPLELIAIYLLTVLSMDLLARAAAKTGIRSFEEMGRLDVTSTCWDLLKT